MRVSVPGSLLSPDSLNSAEFVDLIHAAKPEPSVEILFAVSEEERVVLSQFAEHVNHAQLFCNSLSKVEQRHIVEAAQFELGRVRSPLPPRSLTIADGRQFCRSTIAGFRSA